MHRLSPLRDSIRCPTVALGVKYTFVEAELLVNHFDQVHGCWHQLSSKEFMQKQINSTLSKHLVNAYYVQAKENNDLGELLLHKEWVI